MVARCVLTGAVAKEMLCWFSSVTYQEGYLGGAFLLTVTGEDPAQKGASKSLHFDLVLLLSVAKEEKYTLYNMCC
jgi:hypothetical protein